MLGGARRLLADANYEHGEYGVQARSDHKGAGLGWQLMRIMIEYAHWQGLRVVEGQVLRENRTMLAMCQQLGFSLKTDPDDPSIVNVTLPIQRDGALPRSEKRGRCHLPAGPCRPDAPAR